MRIGTTSTSKMLEILGFQASKGPVNTFHGRYSEVFLSLFCADTPENYAELLKITGKDQTVYSDGVGLAFLDGIVCDIQPLSGGFTEYNGNRAVYVSVYLSDMSPEF